MATTGFSRPPYFFSTSKCKVPTPPQALPKANPNESVESNKKLIDSIAKGLIGLAAAVSVCLDSPALTESLTIAFPTSHTHEVNAVQRTLIETWGLIIDTFVDPTFNHQDWDSKFQQTMVEMLPLRTADVAYSKIKGMLSTLGDCFTHIINPKEYQRFKIESDGNVQGVGLFVNTEPEIGHLVVLSGVEGSAATRAGIHVGDELIEINGVRVKGISGEAVAQKLRGHVGTSVTVKVHNRGETTPEFHQTFSYIKCLIPHRTPNGHVSKTRYVKLLAFSQTAATDMKHAIRELENQGVESYILDLRNNPGGLVKAGLDVAQIWLDGDETLVNTIDRDGNMLPINMINGHALTHDPLVVLLAKHKEVVQLCVEGNFSGEDTVRVTTMNKHGKHDLDIPVIVNPRNDPPFINVPEFIMLENVTEDDIHFPGHIHFLVYNTALFSYALTRFVCRPMHEITFSTIDIPKLLSRALEARSYIMMFHRCSLVINRYEYDLRFQFTLYPIMERIFGPIVVARIAGVMSIPLLMSYPFISMLTGFALSLTLNCASIIKNVLYVSIITGTFMLQNKVVVIFASSVL
ncbi:unnamed protein product [Lactuca saligna]|uniref:PDZ domain-containing protein n=1 Tax=Lactuca saligna TaxID=75948 RepID=A0AA35YNZ1_LACSI|nr:unnamed protein product [Lactuca saligna]